MAGRPKINLQGNNQVDANSRFHIDYEWWDRSTMDLKAYLATRLQALGIDNIYFNPEIDEVDIVDMSTGEVRRVDGFQYVVHTYFQQLPEDFAQKSSLVDSVFCVLLANANQPMTVSEISAEIGRTPDVVLRTIGTSRIYQGISPVID
ncbi:MAG: hypothetical protein ACI9EW_000806 [Cellvibrionaceae bacterium]|jgi:hypothetical protein